MRRYLLFISFSVILFGCEPKEQPVSGEEAMDFAKRLEFSIKKRKINAFDSVFNYEVFGKLVAKEADMKINRSFVRVIKEAIQQRVTKELLEATREGGSYEFIRQYEKEERQHVIFRLYGEDGINYHDMLLTKVEGKVHAADMYIYLSGENLSKTLGSLMGTANQYTKNKTKEQGQQLLASVAKVRKLMDSKQYKEAKELYDQLPSEIKQERVLMLYDIQICSQLGEDEYMKAMEAFEIKYAGDPSAQLPLIDGYLTRKDFIKALKAVDVLDSAVKKDPLLNFSRALIYSQMDDMNNSVKCLELLKKEKPGFEDGLLELIVAYSQTDEQEKAKQVIAEYKANSSFNQDKLTDVLYAYSITE